MVGSRLGRATLGVAALASAQCSRPRTEVVVTVQSEIAWGVGRELQSLVVTVRRGGSDGVTRWQQTRPLGTEAGQWGLPLSFGLYPADASDATPVGVEVLGCAARDGCSASNALVAQRAVVSYRSEQTVGVDLWLVARCRGVVCAASETCARETGQCVAAVSRDRDVYPITGDRLPPVDAAALADATREDAPEVLTSDAVAVDADAMAPDATAPDVVIDAPVDEPSAPDVAPDRVGMDAPVGDVAADDGPGFDAAADRVEDAGPCVAPRAMCGGACVDTMTDRQNCGACGTVCGTIMACTAGRCAAVAPAPLLAGRWLHSAVRLGDGRVLVTGGTPTAQTEIYDPTANRWTPGPSLPEPITGAAMIRWDTTRAYLFGGYNGTRSLNTAYVLDSPESSWRAIAPMPTARDGAVAVATGTADFPNFHVLDGQDSTGMVTYPRVTEVYDPTTNTWRTRARPPTLRSYGCVAFAGTGRYAVFGATATVDFYNAESGSWTVGPASRTPARGVGCYYASDARIHIVGGDMLGRAIDTHDVFNVSTMRFDPPAAPLPIPTAYIPMFGLPNQRLLAVGGRTGTAAAPMASARVFTYSFADSMWR